ncbi:hypothetical protein [Paenarthrobacter sp. C1]|uniref:hypothetical protein n=1 Tax=Paenarthrobacter sp. C1 TaxID=3400220 RepID=UPI003BF46E4F
MPSHTPGVRWSLVSVLLVPAALAGCGGDDAVSYPAAVQHLVDGVTEAGLCDAVAAGPEPEAVQAYDATWSCDGTAGSLRISQYSSPAAAATWVAQSQVIDMCGWMSAMMADDLPRYGELLYEDSSVYGLLEDLEQLQATAGGEVYSRTESFPQAADQAQLVTQRPCGGVEVDPRAWEHYRGVAESRA